MTDSNYYFANHSYHQLAEKLQGEREIVLLFPVGATEAHGPHSPISTDVVISEGMCRRVARALAADEGMDDNREQDVLLRDAAGVHGPNQTGQIPMPPRRGGVGPSWRGG